MVCTDLLGWSDFPKGLRVLLFDEDTDSSAEIKSKLEKMDYIVSSFCNEGDALVAVSNISNNFHVAIVEVNTENSYSRFKFLESAKDIPTIMISNTQCLNTMVKGIALGAVEFLLKPLSDDKLKNLWQHVVHKAFHGRGKDLSEYLNPIKESVFSMLSSHPKNEKTEGNLPAKTKENDHENSTLSDKCQAPPTPQLKQGVRLLDDGDFIDQANFEATSCNIADEVNNNARQTQLMEENIVNNEDQGDNVRKGKNNLSTQPKNKNGHKRPIVHNSTGMKANRKKMKVDWTPELHKNFVKAVEQLGVDQAIPSRIFELMKVDGLTRHNIASHLQKYRMQHRPILPKEDDRRWPILSQRSYYPYRPLMAKWSGLPNGPVYPSWGPHGNYRSGVQMCAPVYYAPWQHNESWHCQLYPGMHADVCGCPVMPLLHEQFQPPPQNVDGFQNVNIVHGSYSVTQEAFDLSPADEEIDRVVKEAINNPFLPLPIGLKLPSIDCVLTEISNQGILQNQIHSKV